jgi:hypothetical protein
VSNWLIPDPAATRWRRWDDEIVVYHAPQAATLLLDGDTAEVFQCLADRAGQPITESELLQRLLGADGGPAAAADSADPSDAAATDSDRAAEISHVRDILDSLRRSGLAECRAS